MNKPIYKYKVAQFLMDNGAEYIGKKTGLVADRPDKTTYFFKNNERLSKALDLYHASK
jgi:hypothetical protein